MNEQDIQDILVALLTEDSVQLGERGQEEGPSRPSRPYRRSKTRGGIGRQGAGDQCRRRVGIPGHHRAWWVDFPHLLPL